MHIYIYGKLLKIPSLFYQTRKKSPLVQKGLMHFFTRLREGEYPDFLNLISVSFRDERVYSDMGKIKTFIKIQYQYPIKDVVSPLLR